MREKCIILFTAFIINVTLYSQLFIDIILMEWWNVILIFVYTVKTKRNFSPPTRKHIHFTVFSRPLTYLMMITAMERYCNPWNTSPRFCALHLTLPTGLLFMVWNHISLFTLTMKLNCDSCIERRDGMSLEQVWEFSISVEINSIIDLYNLCWSLNRLLICKVSVWETVEDPCLKLI